MFGGSGSAPSFAPTATAEHSGGLFLFVFYVPKLTTKPKQVNINRYTIYFPRGEK